MWSPSLKGWNYLELRIWWWLYDLVNVPHAAEFRTLRGWVSQHMNPSQKWCWREYESVKTKMTLIESFHRSKRYVLQSPSIGTEVTEQGSPWVSSVWHLFSLLCLSMSAQLRLFVLSIPNLRGDVLTIKWVIDHTSIPRSSLWQLTLFVHLDVVCFLESVLCN